MHVHTKIRVHLNHTAVKARSVNTNNNCTCTNPTGGKGGGGGVRDPQPCPLFVPNETFDDSISLCSSTFLLSWSTSSSTLFTEGM